MEIPNRQDPVSPFEARELRLLAAVFLILVAARLPALTGPINLSHDATEYIDVARNFASGEGLVLKVRGYFFGDGLTLPYPAASLRSSLFPILMGIAYAVIESTLVFQWFNFFLFLLNLVLLAPILRAVLPARLAAYSLLLVGLSEPMFLTSIFPWAEQTAFFWLLLALLATSRELHVRCGATGALLEGVIAAMAAMSRPEYVAAGVLLFAWLALKGGRRALCIAFLAGFLLPLAAFSAIQFHYFGRFYLPGEYLFRSRHYSSYFSWDRTNSQTPGGFLAENQIWIIKRIGLNAVNYIAKLIGWKNLFLLSIALPSVIWKGLRDRKDWRLRHLALVPGLFFCAYCMIWAGMDRERYLLAVTSFWLPLCLLEVNRWRIQARSKWTGILCSVVMAANLPLALAYLIRSDIRIQGRTMLGERFYARENPAWFNPDMEKLAAWVSFNAGGDDVICLENPFLLNFQTGRLTLLLPEQIRAAEFTKFLEFYRVRLWVNNTVYTNRPVERLAELRKAAENAGAREVARCGSYEVWRIR